MKNHFYAILSKSSAEEILELSFNEETWGEFAEWLRDFVSWNTQNEVPQVISATLEQFEDSDTKPYVSSSEEYWASVPELEPTPWFKVTETEIRVLHTRDEIESVASQSLSDGQWDELVSRILGMYEYYTFNEDLQQFKDA